MALSDDVIARLSTARLRTLTNPDAPSQGTYNAARLTAAVNDVLGDFRLYAGQTYDETKPEHVGHGVKGVTLYLRSYIGQAAADEFKDWQNTLRAMMDQIRWVTPQTTSTLQPSADSDVQPGTPRLPDFDQRRFVNFSPWAPRTGGVIDNR